MDRAVSGHLFPGQGCVTGMLWISMQLRPAEHYPRRGELPQGCQPVQTHSLANGAKNEH